MLSGAMANADSSWLAPLENMDGAPLALDLSTLPSQLRNAASALDEAPAQNLKRANAVHRPKMKRTLPTIDEVRRSEFYANMDRMQPARGCHHNPRPEAPSRFYENFEGRPETVRSASIIASRDGFRAKPKSCARKLLCR